MAGVTFKEYVSEGIPREDFFYCLHLAKQEIANDMGMLRYKIWGKKGDFTHDFASVDGIAGCHLNIAIPIPAAHMDEQDFF